MAHVAGDEFAHRMLANSVRMLSANVANIALGLLQSIITARLLGARGFGEFAVIVAIVGIVNQLTSWRMGDLVVTQVVTRMARNEPRRAGAVVKGAMLAESASSIVAAAVCMLLAPLAQRLFSDGAEIVGAIRVYALVLVANMVFESATGVLRSFNRYGTIARFHVAGRVVRVVTIAIVAVFDGGLLAVAGATVVAQAINCGLVTFAALSEARYRFGARWLRTPLSELTGESRTLAQFAVHTNLGATLSVLVKDTDPLYLSTWHGARQAGYFGLATSLSQLVSLPAAPLADTVLREITGTVARGDVPASRRLIRRGMVVAASWLVPASLALGLGAWFLIPVVYGDEFEPAASTLIALLPGVVIAQTLFWTRPTLLALGRPGTHLRVNILIAVLKVVLVVTLVREYGHVVDAAVLSALYAIGGGISGFLAWRGLGHGSAGDEPTRDLSAVIE